MAETVIPEVTVLHCPNCDSDLWVVAHRILAVKGHIAVESSESRAHSCLYCSYTYEQRLPQNDDGWQKRSQPVVPPVIGEDDGA